MRTLFSILLVFIFVLTLEPINAMPQKKGGEKAALTYGGVATCKACHLSKKSGAQFKKWQAGPHAGALESLKSDKSKEFAKKAGVADPLKSEKCLKCHVTAYGVDAKMKGPKFKDEDGVGCESCHGPGSAYKSRKIMKAIYDGKEDGAKYGLVTPTKEVCVTCHNEESPAYKEFKYEERAAKIAHPKPKADSK